MSGKGLPPVGHNSNHHHSMFPVTPPAPSKFRQTAGLVPALAGFLLSALPLPAQLLSNLKAFPDRIPVGDPQVTSNDHKEGPKGIATADFNGDGKPDLAAGNLDGTITILTGQGGGRFAAPLHLRTGAQELRAVLAVDLNGDGKADLAAASPMDGRILLYFNDGSGKFGAATPLEGWTGVRCLAAGDFDGDKVTDLAAAGPGIGVRHFRGIGQGAFEIMGDLPRLSPLHTELPRPVYVMHTLRSRDGLRDELLVTHAESPMLWILSTKPVDRSTEPAMDLTRLPAWGDLAPTVLLHEVQVHNTATLLDADGTAQPWVELLNKSAAPVNLTGWMLKSEANQWIFPSATILPGRMLVVFLSGKNRTGGTELHTSFLLKQNSKDLSLVQPAGKVANTFILTQHTISDVSFGLTPDRNMTKFFDIPSPGAENNAGLNNPEDLHPDAVTTLTITPRHPTRDQKVTVRVTLPDRPTGTSSVRHVWFSAMPGWYENHHLMHRKAPGIYEEVLPPGAFQGNTPHRVLARLRDGTGNDYTSEIHRGLDESGTSRITAPRAGRLLPVASVPSPKVKSFEVASVRSRAGLPDAGADLVLADEASGLLRVHRAGPGARRFDPIPIQDVPVRGGPRDVKLADTDGDGWLDATVVMRSLDLVLTFKNVNGIFQLSGELPTGRSPREAVMADFSGDGKPDAAVINRYSADISILPTAANLPGLVTMDQIYPVNGEVAGLTVRDFNRDGRDDVMQLHRASGEVSIRYAGPGGMLAAPVFLTTSTTGPGSTGQAPSGLTNADVNKDGLLDTVTANLGGSGSISVILAKPDGTWETPRTFSSGGGMFAVSVADFDKDGNLDVVAGLFDCRVAFFLGDGTGNFTSAYFVTFAYESRVMVTGDFDQDGDTDIAGAGYSGDMVTLENRGAATAAGWRKVVHPAPSGAYGTHRIGLSSINGDSDPDLVIGTGSGVLVYTGGMGMNFLVAPEYSGGLGMSVSDVLMRDLDGDGKLEMVASCRNAACINILTQSESGEFKLVTQADVPSGRYLASGDLDGDGKPDLVGTGDVLWTALSSRPPQMAASSTGATNRTQVPDILINEVLPQNSAVPIATDNGKKTDFVELFNGTTAPAVLTGWKMQLEAVQEGVRIDQTWPLPATTIAAKGHTLILFSAEPGASHTGFTLPAEGGTVTLLKPDNSVADRVNYPPAQENVSWSRYLDGHPAFRADGIPSPGMSNLDNGTVPPEVKLNAPTPSSMIAGGPLNFSAKGRDDSGIMSLSLLWNRLDAPLSEPQRIVLYDDGLHLDGAAVDGYFAGRLVPGLPEGAEVQFYLEAVDLSGEVLLLPDSAELVDAGKLPTAWSFSLTSPPPLEITEVNSNNATGLRDDLGGHSDWVKVRNNGAVPVDMSGILLAKSPLSGAAAVYSFPSGLMLPPSAEVTIFADNNPSQGALHAPFTLDAGGDDVSLLAVRPSGARQWIHSLNVPALTPDNTYRRLPGSTLRAIIADTADLTNWSGTSWDPDGTALATIHFSTVTGTTYRIEGTAAGAPETWTLLETIAGNGAAFILTRPLMQWTALRAVPVTAPFLRVDAAIAGLDNTAAIINTGTAGIYGEARGVTGLTLYYGLVNGGTAPALWSNSVGGYDSKFSSTVPFAWFLNNLKNDATYFYIIKADLPGGGAFWHSAPNPAFRTLNAGQGAPVSLMLSQLNPADATVQIRLNSTASPNSSVELLAGPVDAFSNYPGWQRRVSATRTIPGGTAWAARLSDLAGNTDYFIRARVTSSTGQVFSAQRITFRTPDAKANLRLNLRLSKINYNPAQLGHAEAEAGFEVDDFEYIELHNPSSMGMDLSGLWFENGLEFDFPITGAPVLPPGGYAVIAANPHAFAMRYGAAIPLTGWTLHPFRRARLSNGGERITLRTRDGTTLFDFTYNDSPRWTDGGGYALQFQPPANLLSPESVTDYISNRFPGGAPGQAPLPAADLTFAFWRPLQFTASQLSDVLISGMSADPDGDGLTNFAEFACGTAPLTPDSKDVLSISVEGSLQDRRSALLTFPLNLRAKGINTIIETTTSTPQGLENWVEAGRHSDDHYQSSALWSYPVSAFLSGTGQQMFVTISVPETQPQPTRRFFRLRFAQTP